MTPWTARLATTALLAALAAPAFAQTPPGPGPDGGRMGMGHGHAGKGGSLEEAQQRRQERMQRHLNELKGQLKLSPDQEPAWTAFIAALQPTAKPERPSRDQWAQLTTPQRIDRMQELRQRHAAEADRRAQATKSFYATLNPEQQKTFDAQSLRMMGRIGRGEGHGRHERHHG
ncbi:MAG: Spy/CpxP family protein refolding chaperone [Burkholderiaceae bacterium]